MNIEDLIKQRKNDLDLEQPPADSWEVIQKQWKSQPPTRFNWWKVAAMVLLTLSLGLLIRNQTLQEQVSELASLGDISETYQQVEDDYLMQINQIETEISFEEVAQDEDMAWMVEELKVLDEVNDLYRQDIGKINEDQLVEVLIDYYEKKIRLLRKIQLEIERSNKFKNNENNFNDDISM